MLLVEFVRHTKQVFKSLIKLLLSVYWRAYYTFLCYKASSEKIPVSCKSVHVSL